MHRQPSLFGVEASDPAPADLAGLLAGPAELGRMGGTARVSVVVDAAWRVHVLVAELVRRGLTAAWEQTADGRFAVRSAYSTRLSALAAAWSGEGDRKRAPRPLYLSGHALRLWVAAAGSAVVAADPSAGGPPAADAEGYALGLGARDRDCWPAVGEALRSAGLPAELLGPRAGGPAYLITGRWALDRLAELVGPAPPAAPPGAWPAGAAAAAGTPDRACR
ncbi:MAG: hypothetical protein FWJ70_18195 [Micromonosporaceae bacterium]